MKTKEELNALKNEVETLNKKLADLSEEDLNQVTGGDIEITFDLIMQYIDAGNERMAAGYFKLAQFHLESVDQWRIRMAFWSKFGYPIDMFVE